MELHEYSEVFNRLAAILREKQLGWIVDQVATLIQSGDTVRKDVELVEENWQFNNESRQNSRKTKRKASLLTVKEFDVREQVLLLIDAATQVLTDSQQMSGRVVAEFSQDEDGGFQAIKFISANENEQTTLNIDAKTAADTDLAIVTNNLRLLREAVQ